jgi:hypothetical protein
MAPSQASSPLPPWPVVATPDCDLSTDGELRTVLVTEPAELDGLGDAEDEAEADDLAPVPLVWAA